MRFGLSYSLWECDPESNDYCKLGRIATGEGKCYAQAAQAHFQDLDTTLRANLGEVVHQKGNDGQHCIVRQ